MRTGPAGRSFPQAWPEKAVTTALGILLIAERPALLSGRDDEFVAVVLMGYTGMRWAEVVGLGDTVRAPSGIRVEWQLYELDNGQLRRCLPKDDSHRTVDTPGWLSDLVAGHIARIRPTACPCHGLVYVFRGHGPARDSVRQDGPKLVDVARRAGVSTGTVSAVLNRPGVGAGGDPGQGGARGVRPRLPPDRPVGGGGRALEAQWLRDLAVPSGRERLVPAEGPAGGASRTGAGRSMARYPGPLLWNVGFIIATVSAIGVLLGTFAFVGSVAFGVGCIASARLLRRKQYENAVMATVIGSASSSVITGILQAVTGDYVLGAGSLLLGAFFAQYVVKRAWTGNVGHRLRQLNTRLSQSQ